jgi:hypothetical protein
MIVVERVSLHGQLSDKQTSKKAAFAQSNVFACGATR